MEPFSNYVGNIYRQATTEFEDDAALTTLQRTDPPLSRYLFNITLDWTLSSLFEEVGIELGGTRHGYLAIADDMVLLTAI